MKLIFEANEQEKKEILEQHNLFKEVLQSKVKRLMVNEQEQSTGSGREILIAARDNKKCTIALGGKLMSAPGKPTVLYKIANYDSTNGYFKKGDELYIKDDYTFDVVTTDSTGKKTKSASNKKWACSTTNVVAKESNESNDRNLEGFTPEQKKLILKYTNYKLKSEIGLDEIGSWEQFTLNFPDGSGSVILYKDPTSQSDVEFKGYTDEKTKTLIPSKNRAEVCRKKIQDFADSANKKLKLPMSQINADKSFVMACRDQFGMKYNDLGVTKKNLEYLTGQRDGLDGYKLKVGSPYRV
jgi:flagellin-like hook-associated protein FlgL